MSNGPIFSEIQGSSLNSFWGWYSSFLPSLPNKTLSRMAAATIPANPISTFVRVRMPPPPGACAVAALTRASAASIGRSDHSNGEVDGEEAITRSAADSPASSPAAIPTPKIASAQIQPRAIMLPAVYPATTRGSSDASARRCSHLLDDPLHDPDAAAHEVRLERKICQDEQRQQGQHATRSKKLIQVGITRRGGRSRRPAGPSEVLEAAIDNPEPHSDADESSHQREQRRGPEQRTIPSPTPAHARIAPTSSPPAPAGLRCSSGSWNVAVGKHLSFAAARGARTRQSTRLRARATAGW